MECRDAPPLSRNPELRDKRAGRGMPRLAHSYSASDVVKGAARRRTPRDACRPKFRSNGLVLSLLLDPQPRIINCLLLIRRMFHWLQGVGRIRIRRELERKFLELADPQNSDLHRVAGLVCGDSLGE